MSHSVPIIDILSVLTLELTLQLSATIHDLDMKSCLYSVFIDQRAGLPTKGSNGLGLVQVSGLSLVSCPPANVTAFIARLFFPCIDALGNA